MIKLFKKIIRFFTKPISVQEISTEKCNDHIKTEKYCCENCLKCYDFKEDKSASCNDIRLTDHSKAGWEKPFRIYNAKEFYCAVWEKKE